MTVKKMEWTPSESASLETKAICWDIEEYKNIMDARLKNGSVMLTPGSIELTHEAWQAICSTLKKCPKVAPIRRLKVMPIYHITIHGFTLFVGAKE